jgi:predicted S18 family serine protease
VAGGDGDHRSTVVAYVMATGMIQPGTYVPAMTLAIPKDVNAMVRAAAMIVARTVGSLALMSW